jgi:uncharacterized protein
MVESASVLLSGIDLLPAERAIVDRAVTIIPQELRSLDAIHLASAISVQSHLTAFVAYDVAPRAAANLAGPKVESPH